MKRIHPLILLFIIAILAYGLLIPSLGFYWDDLPMSWIRYQLGPEAMTRYFSSNRPVWGLLYQITTHILPQVPIYWQIFALTWRWLGTVVVWALVRELWKGKPRFALSAALFFLLYPGFNQQWGAYLYSHFFIVLFFFLFSLYLMLRRQTVAALIFSALNLWMMEYFFVLELARIGVIWIALRGEYPDPRQRIGSSLRLWTPYLAVFSLAVLSRLFVFNNQIYGFGLMSQLKTDLPATLLSLGQNAIVSLWTVTFAAWMQVFTGLDTSVHGTRTIALYVAMMLAVLAIASTALWMDKGEERGKRKEAWYAIGLGLFMLPFAGVPFWLIDLPITLGHPANRFTLPSMLGVSLILAGLLELIPRERWRYILLAVLVSLAAGRQFLWSTDYRRDWEAQKNLFWQMTWRAPTVKPNTMVLINENLLFYADNSLGATLNWIYAPDNRTDRIDYVLFYPTNRVGISLPEIKKGVPVKYDYLAGQFNGNTSQALAFYYDPPACLRLLEPDLDSANRFILDESLMREASALSSPDMILREETSRMPVIYAPQPVHGWCYYFQKADLARQFKDWHHVVELGDRAFTLDDYPNNPVERFVFIEGYAHVGNWERAIELSKVSYKVSKEFVGPLLCMLWRRIETETTGGPESDALSESKRSTALSEVKSMFACSSE